MPIPVEFVTEAKHRIDAIKLLRTSKHSFNSKEWSLVADILGMLDDYSQVDRVPESPQEQALLYYIQNYGRCNSSGNWGWNRTNYFQQVTEDYLFFGDEYLEVSHEFYVPDSSYSNDMYVLRTANPYSLLDSNDVQHITHVSYYNQQRELLIKHLSRALDEYLSSIK